MPIKLFDSLDTVPEAQREAALETKDGKFAIDDTSEDEGVRTALQEERTKREAAEKLAKKAADELKKLEVKAKASASGVTDDQLKQLREDVRTELESEYAPFRENATKYEAENRVLRLDTAVKAVMASEKVGVRPERMEKLWDLYKTHFDLTDDGKPMVKNRPGLTVEKYLAETVKADVPEFYVGSQAAGGGASGGSHSGGGRSTITADDILKNPSAALQAARASGKVE